MYLLYVTDMVPAPDRSDACDSDLLRRLDDSERHYDWKVLYGSRSQTITLCKDAKHPVKYWFDCIFDILTVESLAEISNYSRGTFIPTWLSFLG